MNSLWKHITGRPRAVLLALALLSIACVFVLPRLVFDMSAENMLDSDMVDTSRYELFLDQFGRDDNLVILAFDVDEDLPPHDAVEKLLALTERFHESGIFSEVVSIAAAGGGGVLRRTIPAGADAEDMLAKAARIPAYSGTLISRDAGAVAVVGRTKSDSFNSAARKKITAEVKKIADENLGGDYYLSGIPVFRTGLEELLVVDQLKYFPIVALVVGGMLFAVFRTIRGVVLPFAAVAAANLWNLAFMAATGGGINIITSILPTVVAVIGISDAVHLLSFYRREEAARAGRRDAMIRSLARIGPACALTTVTTIVGFGGLRFINMRVIKEFGLYASSGIFFALCATVILIPAVTMMLKRPGRTPPEQQQPNLNDENSSGGQRTDGGSGNDADDEEGGRAGGGQCVKPADGARGPTGRLLQFAENMVFKRTWLLLAASAMVIAFCAAGTTRLRVDHRLLEDIDPASAVARDVLYMQERFSGVLSIEIIIDAAEGARFDDPEILARVAEIENRLEDIAHVKKTMSLPDVLTAVPVGASNLAAAEALTRTGAARRAPALIGLAETAGGGPLRSFATPDYRRLRISLRIDDFGTREYPAFQRSVQDILDSAAAGIGDYEITGTARFAGDVLSSLLDNVQMGFLFALMLIIVIITVHFRSVRLGLISILPNVTPILITAGIMGYLDIALRTSTAVTFIIAFGIAVDDTIHFLTHYRRCRSGGRPARAAVAYALDHAGRAIIFTTLILASGFAALLTSSFASTANFGLLSIIIMAAALIGDLFFLPALLVIFDNREQASS